MLTFRASVELWMAENHRSSTLPPKLLPTYPRLWMAENHRSSTLTALTLWRNHKLWMAENHRSSTLSSDRHQGPVRCGWPRITAQVHWYTVGNADAAAVDGRESPLKYTAHGAGRTARCAVDGRESPLKYTEWEASNPSQLAVDGRESPLKYTKPRAVGAETCAVDGRESPLKYTSRDLHFRQLWMAENHRSSTLSYCDDNCPG